MLSRQRRQSVSLLFRNSKCYSGDLGNRRGEFTASPFRYAVFHAITAARRSSSSRRFPAETMISYISTGVRS